MLFRSIAEGSGFKVIGNHVKKLDEFTYIVDKFKNLKGLKFMHVKCGIDEETPRPPLHIIKVNKI